MPDEHAQELEASADLMLDQDPLLEALVRVANVGVETSVTLMVGGVTIVGTIVGGRQYYDTIARQLRAATTNIPDVAAQIADEFEKIGAEFYPKPGEHEASGDADSGGSRGGQDMRIGFTHLKDVEFINPDGRSVAGAWWRGRLTAVDGFVLGRPSWNPQRTRA